MLARIIPVHRLHSIITHAGGHSSLQDINRHMNFQSINMQVLFLIYQLTNVLHLRTIFGLRVFWFDFDRVYRYKTAIVAKLLYSVFSI